MPMNRKETAGPRFQSEMVPSTTLIAAMPTNVPIWRLALSTDPATFAFSAPAASTMAAVMPGEMMPAPRVEMPTTSATTQYGVDDEMVIMTSDAIPAVSMKVVNSVLFENRPEIR